MLQSSSSTTNQQTDSKTLGLYIDLVHSSFLNFKLTNEGLVFHNALDMLKQKEFGGYKIKDSVDDIAKHLHGKFKSQDLKPSELYFLAQYCDYAQKKYRSGKNEFDSESYMSWTDYIGPKWATYENAKVFLRRAIDQNDSQSMVLFSILQIRKKFNELEYERKEKSPHGNSGNGVIHEVAWRKLPRLNLLLLERAMSLGNVTAKGLVAYLNIRHNDIGYVLKPMPILKCVLYLAESALHNFHLPLCRLAYSFQTGNLRIKVNYLKSLALFEKCQLVRGEVPKNKTRFPAYDPIKDGLEFSQKLVKNCDSKDKMSIALYEKLGDKYADVILRAEIHKAKQGQVVKNSGYTI
jgi:hypothetical protein